MNYLILLMLASTLVWAAEYPDLPPDVQVVQALGAHPRIAAAQALVRVEEANHARLAAGPYELTLRLAGQRRQDRTADQRYREQEIGFERAFRLPGKAARDAEIGAAGVSYARFMYGDALHQTSRQLLVAWFELQRTAAAARDWQAQVALLREQHAAVLKKVSAGETAKLEALLSEAQLAQAEAQLAQARMRRERAAVELRQHFPAIDLPAEATLPPPAAIDEASFECWRERILAENHELAAAREAARKSRLEAGRLDAERLPDPTLGLMASRDRGGQERVVGLQLSIPLPGEARAARARAGEAEAEAATAREALALASAEVEARQTIQVALGSYRQWQRLADVAARMEENVRLLEKAWRLGEGQFAELQNARRQAIEARLAATQAQLDASEAHYRLLLDAHELWDFAEALHAAP